MVTSLVMAESFVRLEHAVWSKLTTLSGVGAGIDDAAL